MAARLEAQPLGVQGVDHFFEAIGLGVLHWGIFFIGGLSLAADGVEIGFVSYVGEAVGLSWGLSSLEKAVLASTVFVGEFLGSLFFGIAGDHYGRRPAYALSNLMVLFFGACTTLAQNLPTLAALRFLVGFGVGGIVIPFDLFMELLEDRVRGRMLSLYMMFWPIGSVYIAGVAWLILPNTPLDHGWRYLALAACAPFLLPFLASFFLPESPRWYISQGRHAEAEAELAALAALNGTVGGEAEVGRLLEEVRGASARRRDSNAGGRESPGAARSAPDENSALRARRPSEGEGDIEDNMLTLFRRPLLAATLTINMSWFVFGFAYYGGQLFFQQLFEDEGGSGDGRLRLNYKAAMLGASFEALGNVFVVAAIDRIGRVRSISTGHVCAAASFFALVAVIDGASEDPKVVFAVMARMFLTVASVSQWIFTPEIYPTSVRATGHALCSMSNRLGAILSPLLSAVIGDAALGTSPPASLPTPPPCPADPSRPDEQPGLPEQPDDRRTDGKRRRHLRRRGAPRGRGRALRPEPRGGEGEGQRPRRELLRHVRGRRAGALRVGEAHRADGGRGGTAEGPGGTAARSGLARRQRAASTGGGMGMGVGGRVGAQGPAGAQGPFPAPFPLARRPPGVSTAQHR